MRLPNGYGSVIKMSGKRRKPYAARKTAGWHYDKEKDKQIQDFVIIGYAETRAEALQLLSNYNNNPYDLTASKMTFVIIVAASMSTCFKVFTIIAATIFVTCVVIHCLFTFFHYCSPFLSSSCFSNSA